MYKYKLYLTSTTAKKNTARLALHLLTFNLVGQWPNTNLQRKRKCKDGTVTSKNFSLEQYCGSRLAFGKMRVLIEQIIIHMIKMTLFNQITLIFISSSFNWDYLIKKCFVWLTVIYRMEKFELFNFAIFLWDTASLPKNMIYFKTKLAHLQQKS